MKGINIVWLSETDLTNLNAGEGESNYIDIKKYRRGGVEYPYVSGQAMRFYLREAIRRTLSDGEYMCVPDDRGETCGEIDRCLNCDLFGFMKTIKDKGAITRVSPVKVSPAQGLLPFDDNANVDFLTRRHRRTEAGEIEGDIVNVEIGTNIYKAGVAIDVVRVGAEERIDENERTVRVEPVVDEDARKSRVKKMIEAIRFISDYSKQARLLTDFTPDVIAVSFQDRYSHRLQKLFELDSERNLNVARLSQILDDVSAYSSDVLFGMVSGVVGNEDEVKELLAEKGIEVLTPAEVIGEALSKV
jgi:CRISPR-associated protein Cst2